MNGWLYLKVAMTLSSYTFACYNTEETQETSIFCNKKNIATHKIEVIYSDAITPENRMSCYALIMKKDGEYVALILPKGKSKRDLRMK